MKDDEMMEAALMRIMDDLDGIEGKSANSHSLEECPDPMNCTQHDSEVSDNLTPEGGKPAADLTIVVGKGMMPKLGSMEKGEEGKAEEGLSAEESAELEKLLHKK